MVTWHWSKEKSARKYVDLIYSCSNKYGVWDPPTDRIRVGDFGVLGKEDGHFQRKGNIYDWGTLKDWMANYPPEVISDSDDGLNITSKNAQKLTVAPAANVKASKVQVAFEGSWSIKSGSGAVLVIRKPVFKTIPREFDVNMLINHRDLRDQFIVTGVTTCPSYAFYLGSKAEESISLTLCGQAPGRRASASAGVSMNWKVNSAAGLHRHGHQKDDRFTVLFELKQCKESRFWQRRGTETQEPEGIDRLADAPPPWGTLDDEGEEGDDCVFQKFDDEDL